MEDDQGQEHLVDPKKATIVPDGARAVMESEGEVLENPADRLDEYLAWTRGSADERE